MCTDINMHMRIRKEPDLDQKWLMLCELRSTLSNQSFAPKAPKKKSAMYTERTIFFATSFGSENEYF